MLHNYYKQIVEITDFSHIAEPMDYLIKYVTFSYLRSSAQTGVYNLCTTENCGT